MLVRESALKVYPAVCGRAAMALVALILTLTSVNWTAGAPGASAAASSGIVFNGSPGTGPAPATLGPYTMHPFAADPQPDGTVSGASGPTGRVTFAPALNHEQVSPDGWQTWSNGYAGDVYATGSAESVTITLPVDTAAFYLYAEPDTFATFSVTATAQDGTSSGPVGVDGQGGAQ